MSEMKRWPDDNGLIDFGEAITDLMKAVRCAYRMRRRLPIADIPWNGYGTPDSAHVTAEPAEALTVKWLRGTERSPMEEILGIAFRLGFTQGKRSERGRRKTWEHVE